MINKTINPKYQLICFYIFIFLAFSLIDSLAAPHPDLLTQLDEFETAISNASDDIAQIKQLVQEKINAFPDDAPFIVAFAAFLVPNYAPDIAEIAAVLMPNLATEIAFAVIYAAPESAETVKNTCSSISPGQNSDITIAASVAVKNRNTSSINFESAFQLAQTAADGADLFIREITPPLPISVYGQ